MLFPTRFHNVVILDWLNFFIGRSQLYKCLHCFDQPQSERKRPGAKVWPLRSTDINKNYVSENRGRKNARQELCAAGRGRPWRKIDSWPLLGSYMTDRGGRWRAGCEGARAAAEDGFANHWEEGKMN